MILWAIFFALGFGAGVLCPDGFRDWVRGAVGWAREKVLGAAPAPAVMVAAAPSSEPPAEVRPARPNKPIKTTTAIKNIFAFFGGLVAWVAKRPVLAIGLVLLAAFLLLGPPSCSPFGRSADALRLERELAEQEARTQEQLRERDKAIAAIRSQTARQLTQIRLESQRGHDAIADATPEHEEPIDPGLVAAWRDSLDRLCVARADGDRLDSCGP